MDINNLITIPNKDLDEHENVFPSITYNLDGHTTKVKNLSENIYTAQDILWSKQGYYRWISSIFIPFMEKVGVPWIVINGNIELNLSLTQQEIDRIRQQGVFIFMYEPIYIVNKKGLWPWVEGQGKPIYWDLDQIKSFKRKFAKNAAVTVFTCEHGMGDFLHKQGLYTDLNFVNFNTYLYSEVPKWALEDFILQPFNCLKKKIISLNYRYEPAREMLTAFLRGTGYHKDSYMSFYHYHCEEEFLKRLPFDPKALKHWPTISNGIEYMQQELPYYLDAVNAKAFPSDPHSIPNDENANQLDDYWVKENIFPEGFAFAYVESRPFSPASEISEKTIKPILSMRPFIIYAAPGFLAHLRKLGFKTFSDFWDESYDLILCPRQRFDAFLDVVAHISQLEINDLTEMGKNMIPILEHNHIHLSTEFNTIQENELFKAHRSFH